MYLCSNYVLVFIIDHYVLNLKKTSKNCTCETVPRTNVLNARLNELHTENFLVVAMMSATGYLIATMNK